MPDNNFLQFSNAAGANVLSQALYAVDAQLTVGNQTGIARAQLNNKVLRQTSTIAAMIAQFICDESGEDAIDDGTLATLLTNFKTAVEIVSLDSAFEAGVKAWFYQNVAPLNWAIDTSAADAVLAVKGGTNAFNVAGGNQAGTWSQPVHYHTTAGHAISIQEMAYHYHVPGGGGDFIVTLGGGLGVVAGGGNIRAASTTSGEGGGVAHYHGNTGDNATAATWRPLAQVGIICTKS